ncbi:MAG: hypothetical protein AAF732_21615 [Pseudomonadota bacterium]
MQSKDVDVGHRSRSRGARSAVENRDLANNIARGHETQYDLLPIGRRVPDFQRAAEYEYQTVTGIAAIKQTFTSRYSCFLANCHQFFGYWLVKLANK